MHSNLIVFHTILLASIVMADLPDFILNPQIVGGREVEIIKYPFIVSLRIDGEDNCGASIISNNFVLTAAHCVNEANEKYSICAGNSKRLKCLQSRDVKKVIIHEQYSKKNKSNDIALLELDEPLEYGSTIKPIKLARKKLGKDEEVKVLGWGVTTEEGTQSRHLKKVNLHVFDKKFCSEVYHKVVEIPITDKMICAGSRKGGKDTCQGDSGGPMVYNGILYGVTSFGYGCGREGYPGIYTSVAKYRGWIKQYAHV